MRIIYGKKCYVQVYDLYYLLINDACFTQKMYDEIMNNYDRDIEKETYVEVNNNYIKNNSLIFNYDYLMSKSEDELNELIDEVIRNSMNISSIKNIDLSKELFNRKYKLNQIKEVMRNKKSYKKVLRCN